MAEHNNQTCRKTTDFHGPRTSVTECITALFLVNTLLALSVCFIISVVFITCLQFFVKFDQPIILVAHHKKIIFRLRLCLVFHNCDWTRHGCARINIVVISKNSTPHENGWREIFWLFLETSHHCMWTRSCLSATHSLLMGELKEAQNLGTVVLLPQAIFPGQSWVQQQLFISV